MRLRSRSARLKKKTPPGGAASGRTGGHGDDAVLLASWAHRQGTRHRGKLGSIRNWRLIGSARVAAPTCKPRWVVWSVCCRSNRHARSWLGGAWKQDEKAVRRIAAELGAQMLATRTRDLMRFRAGELPAGNEFAGKSIAVGIDGGRVRVRTIVKKIRVSGKRKRKKFRVEWREPKVVILFEVDKKGRMVRGSRPVIDGTLQGPDALIELVAFHLHRMGAAKANVVTFAADGAPWIWKRLDWIVAQVKLDPCRVVEVLDWCHAVHHLSVALAASASGRGPAEGALHAASEPSQEGQEPGRDRRAVRMLAVDEPGDSAVWREIRYLTKHSDAGRLRYNCFRCRGVPMGSGAIESTIRRVINLRLKGNGILLDGGECGGRVPTAGCRRFRSVGRDPGAHAGGDGEGSTNRLALDTTGMLGRVESAR